MPAGAGACLSRHRRPIYSLDGVTPKIAPDAFIAPTAAVIGDVEIGVGNRHLVPLPGARRHSTSSASARARNIQDGTIIHVDSGASSTTIGDDVTVGHNAVIHACTLKDRAFVGIAAHCAGWGGDRGGRHARRRRSADAGQDDRAERVLGWVAGPLIRVMSDEERRKFDRNAEVYRAVAAQFRAGLRSAP